MDSLFNKPLASDSRLLFTYCSKSIGKAKSLLKQYASDFVPDVWSFRESWVIAFQVLLHNLTRRRKTKPSTTFDQSGAFHRVETENILPWQNQSKSLPLISTWKIAEGKPLWWQPWWTGMHCQKQRLLIKVQCTSSAQFYEVTDSLTPPHIPKLLSSLVESMPKVMLSFRVVYPHGSQRILCSDVRYDSFRDGWRSKSSVFGTNFANYLYSHTRISFRIHFGKNCKSAILWYMRHQSLSPDKSVRQLIKPNRLEHSRAELWQLRATMLSLDSRPTHLSRDSSGQAVR